MTLVSDRRIRSLCDLSGCVPTAGRQAYASSSEVRQAGCSAAFVRMVQRAGDGEVVEVEVDVGSV